MAADYQCMMWLESDLWIIQFRKLYLTTIISLLYSQEYDPVILLKDHNYMMFYWKSGCCDCFTEVSADNSFVMLGSEHQWVYIPPSVIHNLRILADDPS